MQESYRRANDEEETTWVSNDVEFALRVSGTGDADPLPEGVEVDEDFLDDVDPPGKAALTAGSLREVVMSRLPTANDGWRFTSQ